MPEAGHRVDVAEFRARRTVDLEIVVLVHRECGVETHTLVDQTAVEQQRARRRSAMKIQLHVITGMADASERAAMGIDYARARKHDALTLRAPRREKRGNVSGGQLVVVIEKVEPFAARRFDRG